MARPPPSSEERPPGSEEWFGARPPPSSVVRGKVWLQARPPPSSVVRGKVRGEASEVWGEASPIIRGTASPVVRRPRKGSGRGLPRHCTKRRGVVRAVRPSRSPPRAASWRRRRRGRGAKRRSAGGGTALGPDSRQFRGDDDGGAEGRNHRENHSPLKAGRAKGLLPRQRPE